VNRIVLALLLVLPSAALAQWKTVAPGVEYRHFVDSGRDIHVTRIDLLNQKLRVIASSEADRGLTVREFAKKRHAIVAINGDYFDKDMNPIGLAVGACGAWKGTRDTKREAVVAFGDGNRAHIDPEREVMDPPEPWIEAAVSGWPSIVVDCDARTSSELPGSDGFTRTAHPRTAVGLTFDRRQLVFVVADGRRANVPGLTLAELARFMADELSVCTALNLDGGGSTTMWVDGRIVNKPSDGFERPVADHLAIIASDDAVRCETIEVPMREATRK